mgnify:CR=1 FL=1
MKAAFHKAGIYTIRFWLTSGNEELVISRDYYVSDSGISRVPSAPKWFFYRKWNVWMWFVWRIAKASEMKQVDAEKILQDDCVEEIKAIRNGESHLRVSDYKWEA